jgi:CRP-like cAMP-binding protein
MSTRKITHQSFPLTYPPFQETCSTNLILRDLLRLQAAGDLLNDARIVSLKTNQPLYEDGDKIEFVYFPFDSVIANLGIMEDGTTLETSMIGREGLLGISAILGSGFQQHWSWVTVSGEAVQVEAKKLDKVFIQNEATLKTLLECYRSLTTQACQRSICNSKHTVLQRLCCWLLMVHDRVGRNNLTLTQEMMASRVGARRAGITVAARILQEARAIEYRRGQLYILDREVLEEVVCKCYAIMKFDSFDGNGPLLNI